MRRILSSLPLLAISIGFSPCAAQVEPAGIPSEAAPAPVSAEHPGIAARLVARVALADLKLAQAPAERDFRIAADLLEFAHQLDPADADILRLLIQAWTSAGDADRVDELNRKLLALDPRDTVTQLSVVSARINRLQNVDDRLAAYERFLGPEGRSLDASIRSRLAMDAALLKRERGDDAGFASTLATACQLDPTNKDAATLALAYFAERVSDEVGRFELLTNVLKADPFDPEVHAAIAKELATFGAVRAADRFYNSLAQLRVARGEQMTPQESAEAIVSDWDTNGAEEMIRRLTDNVEGQRAELRSRRQRMIEAGEVLTRIADPAEVRLSIPFERTRVVAAAALGDPELIGYAIEEATESIRRTLDALNAQDPLAEQRLSQEEKDSMARSLRMERVWLRLWSGRTTDLAAAEFEELKADAGVDPLVIRRMAACLKLRQGQLEDAERELKELAAEDVLAAVALGILAEIRGQTGPAAELYTALSRRLAGSIAGAFCRTRVIQLTGKPPAPSDTARELQRLADAIPRTLESMIADPRRFMDVRVEVIGTETRLLDKILIKFTIENTSRFPLAMGPEKPLNTRFMLAPIIDIGVERMGLPSLQEVVWLNRRLRMMPGERFEATVWADSGVLGSILQRIGGSSARVRWRVLQGFRLNREGFYDPGPLCLTSETATIARPVVLRNGAEMSSLIGWIEKGTPREMAESILALIERLSTQKPGESTITQEDVVAAIQAMVNRYRSADLAEKAILLALCPSAMQLPPATSLDAAAIQDPDDGLVKFILGTRVPVPTSPALAPDAWSTRPSVQTYCDLVRERLETGVKTIATIGGRDPGDAPAPQPAPNAPSPAPANPGG